MQHAHATIRLSNIEDHAQIKSVLTTAYSVLLVDSYTRDVLSMVLPFICEPNPDLLMSGTYFVATCDTAGVIGCGGWTAVHPHTGDTDSGIGHIRHFAVHPDQSGRGVGRLLFDACLAQAQTAGTTSFESCATINAERFYHSLGFETVAREDVLIGGHHPFPSVIMTRRIGEGDAA